jgi:thioesterase domain-containing protein
MPVSPRALGWQEKLHQLLPLSVAMGVRVDDATDGRLRFAVPLAMNANDKGTGFGGSIAALGIMAGWSAVSELCEREFGSVDVVIQHADTDYVAPAESDFAAIANLPDAADRRRFLYTLKRRGRSRIVVTADVVAADNVLVARVRGQYVARKRD